MRALLAHRDARLLLVGQSLSLFGDRAMYQALSVWVKTLTGSSADAGLVFFVLAAPGLVAPAFGLAVDRMRKRPLMIATDIAIGLVLLTLLFVHRRGGVWIIYAVTLVYWLPRWWAQVSSPPLASPRWRCSTPPRLRPRRCASPP